MPWQKGHPRYGGMVKGQKSFKTSQWDEFEKFMMTAGLERLEGAMKKIDDETFIDKTIQMMNYFKPKKATIEQRTEHTFEGISNEELREMLADRISRVIGTNKGN